MLRAEIHLHRIRSSGWSLRSFNSHATRGNSPLFIRASVWTSKVSIPMLRAGIHQAELSLCEAFGMVSIPMLRAGIHWRYLGGCRTWLVSIPMLRAGIHPASYDSGRRWKLFQFPCYAREFTSYLLVITEPYSSFNSHATRGNSLVRRRSTYYKIGFQFPCYAREFTKAASHGITWSIVSIPMLRAEIHSGSLEYLHHNSSFNSHATRGNSLAKNQKFSS